MKIRWIVAATAALAAPMVQAQAAADCGMPGGLAAMQANIKTSLDGVRSDQKAREAEIDRVLAQRAAANGGSKDRQARLFSGVLGSPKFAAFEKEGQPFAMEIMSIALATHPKQACANGQRLKPLVGQVKAMNDGEYGYRLDEVKAAELRVAAAAPTRRRQLRTVRIKMGAHVTGFP